VYHERGRFANDLIVTHLSSTPATPDGGGSASASGPALGFAEGEPQKLDPRAISVDLIANWIVTGVLAIAGTITAVAAAPRGSRLAAIAVVLAVVGLLCWWGRRWARLTFAHTSYIVSPRGCEIRRGVVWRQIVSVPRSRIQHTDVTQGPLQRLYGLGTLVLFTAGTQHAQIGLSGVSFETAMAIRQYLVDRTDDTSAADALNHAAIAAPDADIDTNADADTDADTDRDASTAIDAAGSHAESHVDRQAAIHADGQPDFQAERQADASAPPDASAAVDAPAVSPAGAGRVDRADAERIER